MGSSRRNSRRLESRHRDLVFRRNMMVPAPNRVQKRPAGSNNAADKLIKRMMAGILTSVIVTLDKVAIHRSGRRTWLIPRQINPIFFYLSIPQAPGLGLGATLVQNAFLIPGECVEGSVKTPLISAINHMLWRHGITGQGNPPLQ